MPPRRPSLVLLAVSTAILLDALDLSITQVALPEIGRTLDVSAGTLAWIPNGYVLSYGALLLLGGRLADLFGRRRIFLIGLALFGAMSVVGGLATSAPVLIAARVVQGAGAALTVPAAVAIIAASFAEGAARNRALGVFGASASAGFSVGLVLGGILTDALSWRWIFLVKARGRSPRWSSRSAPSRRRGRPARPAGLDGPGALCSAAGVLLVALAITQAGDATLAPVLVAAAALAGAGLLAAFLLIERRAVAPLLPLALFSDRTVRTADLASLTVLAAPFGLAYVTTLWMQQLLGFSALHHRPRAAAGRRPLDRGVALRRAVAPGPSRAARDRHGGDARRRGRLPVPARHRDGAALPDRAAAGDPRVPRPRHGRRLSRLHDRRAHGRRRGAPGRGVRRPEHGAADRRRPRAGARQHGGHGGGRRATPAGGAGGRAQARRDRGRRAAAHRRRRRVGRAPAPACMG